MKDLSKILIVLFFVFSSTSCKKDKTSQDNDNPSPPVLITGEIKDINFSSAKSGGTITIEAGTHIIARGVCWNTSGNPTISDSKTDDGPMDGVFSSVISPLKINTKYFVRAYASTSTGTTSYGNELAFTTPDPKVYIRAKLGIELLECYYSQETHNNYYNYTDNPGENHFYLVMHTDSDLAKSKMIQIDINRIGIDTLNIPWENAVPPHWPEYINIYVMDLQRGSNSWGIYDSINYMGTQMEQDPVYLKISAITGDTIQGTFHGTLKTRTGLTKELTDGEFKIKFHTIVGPWK